MAWPWPDVPAPPFGIDEMPGAPTIDRPASTTGNLTVPAGGVLRLLPGVHNISGRTWTLNGTQSEPVFVIAEPGAVVDCLGTSQLTLAGQYAVLIGLDFYRARLRTAGQQIVLRGCAAHGWPGTSSTVIVSLLSGVRNFVADGCHIYENGPQTTVEADIHAHKASAGTDVTDVWIIRGHYHNNSGDSVQLGSATGTNTVERVYIVGNDMHDEGENGVDLKLCRNVLVAYNAIRDMRTGLSDPGRGIVVHDAADLAVIRDNEVTDCDGEGIVSSGSTGLVILRNKVRRCGAGNAHGAIRVYGSTGAEVSFNSVWESPVPYEFSTNPAVNAHDNLTDPPEEQQPPGAPAITTIQEVSPMQVRVTITPSGAGGAADSFDVRRTVDGAAPVVIAILAAGTVPLEHVDTTIAAGHVYGYSARAYNAWGSEESPVNTHDTRPPDAPAIDTDLELP